MEENKCEKCGKVLSNRHNLQRHIKNNSCRVANFECKYCKKKFTDESNMYRHIRNSCKEKKNQEDEKENIYKQLLEMQENMAKMKDDMTKIQKENNELKNKVAKIDMKDIKELKEADIKIVNNNNNGTVNNGTINIQNNITLVAHNKEDMAKIKDEMGTILQNGFQTSIRLTEALHFNPKYPEYHNVYISNMKDKYAMVYDGTDWKLVMKNTLIDQLYDNKKNYIEDNLENLINSHKLRPSQINALKRWLDTDDESPKIKDIKEQIKLLLYNNRNIPITTYQTISPDGNEPNIKVIKKKSKVIKIPKVQS